MTIPSVLFALVIASLYGVFYHLIRGGGLGRLLLFLILGWAGFALGHIVGVWRDWSFISVGDLNLGLSTLGSLVMLVIGDLASRGRANGPRPLSGRDNRV